MAVQMNIAKAKAKLSELVARAEAGEEVVLTRAGKPVVALVPQQPPPAPEKPWKKVFGALAHLGPLQNPDIFFEPDPDIEEMLRRWENESFG